jgi:hypothetical protein
MEFKHVACDLLEASVFGFTGLQLEQRPQAPPAFGLILGKDEIDHEPRRCLAIHLD